MKTAKIWLQWLLLNLSLHENTIERAGSKVKSIVGVDSVEKYCRLDFYSSRFGDYVAFVSLGL